ncbi:MAG: hypothetical protein JST63_01380 [Bacteroidetes bacterium]|nr:hypothetical protein [Bacteroidota bacterium]
MKKVLAFILSFFYLFTTTGATFHLHYCMGKLVNVKLGQKETKKCSKCKSEETDPCSKNCCKDAFKTVKFEKEYSATDNIFPSFQLKISAKSVPYAELPLLSVVSCSPVYSTSNAPPRSNNIPIYLLHNLFLI